VVEVLRKSNLRHLPALYEAAVLYEADGQADQAIAAYKKIGKRDRHHLPTLSRLADFYRKKGLLGGAPGVSLQGARRAMQAMQYKDARHLVDSALQIEDDNWEARRLQTEVAKADPEGAKQAEAPAAQRVAAAPASAKPAQAPAQAAPAARQPAPPTVAMRPAPAPHAPRTVSPPPAAAAPGPTVAPAPAAQPPAPAAKTSTPISA